MTDNDYTSLRDTLKGLDKKTLCYLISDMMFFNKIDITDINHIHIERLREKIAEKDRIIHEADNCIFNSLFYDKENKVDSINVITQKLKWLNEYGDRNTDYINKEFRYEHKV